MSKQNKNLTQHCPKCKHDHVAKTGPCLKTGCPCNYFYNEDKKSPRKKEK